MKTHAVKNNLIKKSVLALASLLTIMSIGINAKEQSFQRAQKELKIMSKIFETSLAELHLNDRQFIFLKETQATYLAKQGMVFNFDFGRDSFSGASGWEAFGEGIGQLVGGIASEVGAVLGEVMIAPEAPVPRFDFGNRFEAYGERMEALEILREKHENQREDVREIQREIRRMEREKNSAEGDNKRYKQLKEKMERKMDLLKNRMAEYKTSMADYRKKRDQKYTQRTKLKFDVIMSTLCDYGATLRSLKNNEYITIIFDNYSDNKDQVYVFDFDDVRTCKNKEKLLKQAISYQL